MIVIEYLMLNGLASKVNSVVVTVFELIAVPRLILPLTLATHLGLANGADWQSCGGLWMAVL